MEKAEIARAAPAPMRKRNLQQNVGADHIGVDEFGRTVDRSVDMTFGRQMDDSVGIKTCKQTRSLRRDRKYRPG